MQKIKSYVLILLLFVASFSLYADGDEPKGGGMWLPMLLKAMGNEADMQAMGMKLSAEDIYSINQASLKDAVMIFGGGCTAEAISPEGLILTNHHCGYGQIQSHSSVENDYLTDGFWAMSRKEELTNPGLSVTFIVRMEDVTDKVLEGVSGDDAESVRNLKIANNISKVVEDNIKDTHYKAQIKPFFYGNEYYMIVSETFEDVRLVGAPPSGIGKFGGDTDNWMWPRHTGDFMLFRVYADTDGKPAAYSEDNVPLKPRHFFPVSMRGVKQDDFTMVFGFPGRTQLYLPNQAVETIMNVNDPIRIALRDIRLSIMDEHMKSSDKVRIQYASKYAGISNGYKKWQGEILGLTRTNALQKKKDYEAQLTQRINQNPEWKEKYGTLLEEFELLYKEMRPTEKEYEYFMEALFSIEPIGFSRRVEAALGSASEAKQTQVSSEELQPLVAYATYFFKNYHQPLDKQITIELLKAYREAIPKDRRPSTFKKIADVYKNDIEAYVDALYKGSMFTNENLFEAWAKNPTIESAIKDPMIALSGELINHYFSAIKNDKDKQSDKLDRLMRDYMQVQRLAFADDKKFFPDANFTLRVTYGRVEGYEPRDGVVYDYYTTIEGIIEKHDPDEAEFNTPKRLLELYENKDYGGYADENGELRICFAASNHTTGGNSGSPVIDGEGNLIGINFDRGWEGTMSDINYDRSLCRNIATDARYILFVIDKFAGAGYLLEEMTIVK
ncbi:MAG: S46 family peptidase [Bernardetiaceae bacterium]|nr:S46 family peptidase [Bernardetiaceae bacterium]